MKKSLMGKTKGSPTLDKQSKFLKSVGLTLVSTVGILGKAGRP